MTLRLGDLDNMIPRYCILLDQLAKHDIHKRQVEWNIGFLQSLRSEWKLVAAMVKIREGINHCSLADLYDLLRTHESDLHGLPGGVLGKISRG